MYYGTPPIVTNGLVLNLDAANSLSIPVDPTVNQATSPLVFTSNYSLTVTASNNTTLNYDNTLTAGTISGNVGYFTRTSGYSPSLAYSKRYATSWLLKYSNLTSVTITWGGAHTGNRTNFDFDLQTGNISSLSLAAGENYGSYNLGNGWYQVWYTSTTTGSGINNYRPQITMGSGSVFIGGIQIEMNNYATPFTTSSRTSWFDLSGLNNTTTLSSSSISSSIPSYRSLDQRILNFDGTGSFAIQNSVWSYLSSSATEAFFSVRNFVSSSGNTSIGGYDQSDTGTFSLPIVGMIAIDNSTRKVFSSVITTTQVYRTVTSTTTLNTGSYYHVVLNKDTTNGILQLYVNGILESSNTFDTGSYAQWTTTGSFRGSNTVRLSNTLSTNTSFNTKFFNGAIPTFRIYNRVLSQQEITQNYNALKSRFGLQ